MKKIYIFFIAILAVFISAGSVSAESVTTTIGPVTSYGFLNGADGSDWLYTASFTEEKGYYTYMEVKVYDAQNNLVSTIADSLNVEGATGVRQVMVQPYITKKFFNFDNNYEVMVFVYANTSDYKGKYLHDIYSLVGETAKKLYSIEGEFHMAENMSVDSYSESYIMIFQRADKTDEKNMILNYDVYTKASYASNGKAELKHTFTVDYKYISSSGEEPSPILMVNNAGKANYVLAQYEKPYFTIPENLEQDLIVNKNNNLIIKYYNDKFSLVHETKIPVEMSLEYLYSFPCLGGLNITGDVLVNYNGSNNPAYIITVKNYQTSSDSYITSYKLYDVEGNKLKDIMDGVVASQKMSHIAGQPEQWLFAREVSEGGVFTFVDFPTCEVAVELPVVTKDEVVLSPLIDRYAKGDSYQYVVALLQGELAEDGSAQHKIAWFSKDGVLEHYDVLNFGKNVENAMINISAEALNPWLFDTDDAREYMVIVTKSKEGTTAKEKVLCICSTNGDILAEFVPDDNIGDLGSVCLLNVFSSPKLMCPYSNGRDITLQFTELPLNNELMLGEGTEEKPYQIRKAYDFTQIEKDLDACYEVVNDIDFMNVTFSGVKGEFSGKLNGGNFEIKNAVFVDGGLFNVLKDSAVVENIVLRTPIMSLEAGSNSAGIIANVMMGGFDDAGNGFGCKMSNVHVVSPVIVGADEYKGSLGGLVGEVSLFSAIEGCSMSYADIFAKGATQVGGIAGQIATTTVVSVCAFEGTIETVDVVGGIVATSSANDNINNCHVDAYLLGGKTIGGIVGNSDRTSVSNCYVEGIVELMEDAVVGNVGGVIGKMGSTLSDTIYELVYDNVVALEEIKLPEIDELYAHRIVGFSNGDSFEYDYDKLDESKPKEEWPKIYGAPERCLKDNYVVSDLACIDVEIELTDSTTEGSTMDLALLTNEWLVEHGFMLGEDCISPWVLDEDATIRLWYETFEKETAIENVEADERVVLNFDGETLMCEGDIYLYSMNGVLMKYGVECVNVSELPMGVYVVKTSNGVSKIIIK